MNFPGDGIGELAAPQRLHHHHTDPPGCRIFESFLSGLDWRLKKKISNLAHPVIIGVPGISGEAEVEEGESINVLIKRALGFDISKK